MATTDVAPDVDPFADYPSFAGIRNDLAPERFGLEDLADGVNIDLDDRGRPSLRTGSTQVYAAASGAHSLWASASGDPILFVEGAQLRRLAPDLATAATIAGVTPGARLACDEHAGRVYAGNGFEALVIEGGLARRWGIAPPAGLIAAPTAGTLPPGRYLYTATYFALDGRESGARPAEVIDLPDGGGFTVAIPDSDDPQVVAKVLYCSSANGDALYEVGIGVGAGLTFSDSALRLQRPLATLHYGPAPAGTEIAIYRGIAYVAVGSVVWHSAPFGLELFRGDAAFPMPDAVTLVAATEDGIYVGTERETCWFGGDTPETMTVVRRHGAGAVRGTCTKVPASHIKGMTGEASVPVWLSTDGIVAGLPGGTLVNLSEQWRFEAPAAGASVFFRSPGGSRLLTSFNGA